MIRQDQIKRALLEGKITGKLDNEHQRLVREIICCSTTERRLANHCIQPLNGQWTEPDDEHNKKTGNIICNVQWYILVSLKMVAMSLPFFCFNQKCDTSPIL